MKKTVAVLGCGPAGLLTAHAVHLCGHEPVIYSKPEKSRIGGAQYLHVPIPEITQREPDGVVHFVKAGTAQTYAKKVYGDPDAETSWLHYPEGPVGVWSMRDAYDRLWDMYQKKIWAQEITYDTIVKMLVEREHAAIISSIDLRAICYNPAHDFSHRKVLIEPMNEKFKGRGNTILMDGTPTRDWYRRSIIFGHGSTEWPYEARLRQREDMLIAKPLQTTCTCWKNSTQVGTQVHRVGRFGEWKKGVLVHDAFIKGMAVAGAL